MMPANKDADRHEVFWMRAADSLTDTRKYIEGLIAGENPLSIVFECKSNDLLASGARAEPHLHS